MLKLSEWLDAMSPVMASIVLPLVLIIYLIVLWRLLRGMQNLHNLLMYFGKQIEDLRRVSSAATPPPRETGNATARGMYDILMDTREDAKKKNRTKA